MRFTEVAALGMGVVVTATAASAQEAASSASVGNGADAISEVIVSAQKRLQNIQDVGIAMQAYSSERLAQFSIQDSTGIAEFTPGVSVSANSGGQQANVSIRGVTQNDYNDIVESPNAVYLDDAYIPFAQGQSFALLDIERVEVQKGPQGTLFGRNATGGLIQYISRKPSFDGMSGYMNIETGVLDSPGSRFHPVSEAAIGGPVTDTLAARVAVKWDQQSPYVINKYPEGAIGPLNGTGADLGGSRTFAGRGSVLFKPSENFTSLFTVNGGHTRLGVAPFEQWQVIALLNNKGQQIDTLFAGPNETRNTIAADGSNGGWDPTNSGTFTPAPGRPVPGGDFFGFKPTQPWVTSSVYGYDYPGFVKTYGFDLKNVWDVSDAVAFTSVTDYKKFDKRLFVNTNGGPFAQLTNSQATDAWDLSQELRLNGKAGRLDWQTGFYYLLIDNHSSGALGVLPAAVAVESLAHQRTRSYSLFGQLDWNFAEKWTLVAGARGTEERKAYHFQQALYAQPDPLQFTQGDPIALLGPNPDGSAFDGRSSTPLWTGKLQLEYRPQDALMIYAGVNRGVKAGGFNAQLPGGRPVPVSYTPYKEEVLVNYEGGVKSSWLDRKLQVNLSAFHYDYKDYQAFLFDGVGGLVINRDAKTTGGEVTVEARPMKGLDILAGASYTHSRIYNVPLEIGYDIIRTVQPSYTPPFRASIAVRHSHDFAGGTLSESANGVYADGYYFNLRNFTADSFESYYKVGVGVDWLDSSGRLNLGFNVENLTNERIETSGFDLAIVCGCSVISYQLPRTYNLTLRYSF